MEGLYREYYHRLTQPMMRKSISAEEGAKTGIYLAESSAVEGVTGKLFEYDKVIEYNQTCADEQIRKRLMKLSFEAAQLT